MPQAAISRRELVILFTTLFGDKQDELRNFLTLHTEEVGREDPLSHIPIPISPASYIFYCADILVKHGLADAKLFSALQAEFPNRSDDIDRTWSAAATSAIPDIFRGDGDAGADAPFRLADDWISRIAKAYRRIREKSRIELDLLADVFGNVGALSAQYIEPECVKWNPADLNEENPILDGLIPIKNHLNEFFGRDHVERDGRNQLFILADAGMGKTSLLLMLRLAALTDPTQESAVYLEKLGKNTLEKLSTIRSRQFATLLLDSLDEDPTSWVRASDRIEEILRETRGFRHVIITCRTQFFPPLEGSSVEGNRRVRIGEFRCPLIYLAPFSNRKVIEYLDKRFPPPRGIMSRLRGKSDETTRHKIEQIVSSMKSLRFRPMLLAYADDLLDVNPKSLTGYVVYQALVDAWLRREVREKPTPSRVSSDDVLLGCQLMAAFMNAKQKTHISEGELNFIITHKQVRAKIGVLELGGRSLLNKTSDGEYRFAHFSIQEFLICDALLRDRIKARNLHITRQMIDFCLDCVPAKNLDLAGADLCGENLSGLHLDGICLRSAILRNANLANTSLTSAVLERIVATGANLLAANLGNANLRDAVLGGAILRKCRLDGAEIRGVYLVGADLTDCTSLSSNLKTLDTCNLENAKSDSAPLTYLISFGVRKRNPIITLVSVETGEHRTFDQDAIRFEQIITAFAEGRTHTRASVDRLEPTFLIEAALICGANSIQIVDRRAAPKYQIKVNHLVAGDICSVKPGDEIQIGPYALILYAKWHTELPAPLA